MTDLMIHDVTNPPLAARFFSYALLSGYEVVAQNDSASISMKGILNDYPDIVKPVVEPIAAFLSNLYNISYRDAIALAYSGLKDSTIYQSNSTFQYEGGSISKYEIEDVYRAFVTNTKGVPLCN